MIIDLNQLKNKQNLKKYDVCICGAGPAGITLARTLATKGQSVALLEGGGLEFSEDSQDSYGGKSVGLQYYEGLKYNRLRFFGGTSNHWAGRCSFFDDVDFEQRNYFGLPGWPIKREELFNYFDEAAKILDISREGFAKSQGRKWRGENFRFSEYTLSAPTRFGKKYADELKRSNLIDVYLNANLTEIRLNQLHDEVTHYEVQNYLNNSFQFKAKRYVLALGAIENARLLLNSDKQIKSGLGNQSDLVGRCFMEHLNIQLGRFIAEDDEIWSKGDIQLNPNSDLIRKLNIGNSVIAFGVVEGIKSYGRLGKLKSAIKSIICKSDLSADISRKIVEFDCPGDGVISTLMEQTPNPKSRIKLGTELDKFGLRRVVLDWQLSESDYATIHTLGLEVAKEMAKTGLARVKLHDFVINKTKSVTELVAHAHHLGTTRMSKEPRFGVVNENLKIHGMNNIYIAGSSVFPTGGGCNPTFTIVMMALRLAEHLSAER